MTRSLKTSKVTTIDYELEDVRALLAENAEEALGRSPASTATSR